MLLWVNAIWLFTHVNVLTQFYWLDTKSFSWERKYESFIVVILYVNSYYHPHSVMSCQISACVLYVQHPRNWQIHAGKRHQLRARSSLFVLFIRAFHVHKAYRRSAGEPYSSSLTTLTAHGEYISAGFRVILLSSSRASARWILWKDYQSQKNATGPLKVESRWSCLTAPERNQSPFCAAKWLI